LKTKVLALLAATASALALAASAGAGAQYVGSSAGGYGHSSVDYTNAYNWYRVVGSGRYHWYVFTGGGTLQADGVSYADNGGWSGGWNYRYWQVYNASGAVMGFDVYWP